MSPLDTAWTGVEAIQHKAALRRQCVSKELVRGQAEPSPEQDSGGDGSRYTGEKRQDREAGTQNRAGGHITGIPALRLYFDPAYTDVARMVGYAGMAYRDFAAGLQQLMDKHGHKAEAASWHIVTFEGQMTSHPKPLAQVALRQEVRKLCFQLLGPPPEHPEHARFYPDGIRQEPQPKPKPNGRKKAS